MEDNLIYDINPLVISRIARYNGYRIGEHPYKRKYLRKKKPILALFGFFEQSMFSSYVNPAVDIYGSNGELLRKIICKNNDNARVLQRELNDKLNLFLCDLKVIK